MMEHRTGLGPHHLEQPRLRRSDVAVVVNTVLDRIPFWLGLVNSTPILEPILVGIGIFTGEKGILTHGHLSMPEAEHGRWRVPTLLVSAQAGGGGSFFWDLDAKWRDVPSGRCSVGNDFLVVGNEPFGDGFSRGHCNFHSLPIDPARKGL